MAIVKSLQTFECEVFLLRREMRTQFSADVQDRVSKLYTELRQAITETQDPHHQFEHIGVLKRMEILFSSVCAFEAAGTQSWSNA